MGVIPTRLTVQVCNGLCGVVEEGSNFIITGHLEYMLGFFGIPMAGSLVTVDVSGLVSGTFQVNTDNNGNFAIGLTAPNSTGSISVNAQYNGNAEFDASSASTTVPVVSQQEYSKLMQQKELGQIIQYAIIGIIMASIGVTLGVVFSR